MKVLTEPQVVTWWHIRRKVAFKGVIIKDNGEYIQLVLTEDVPKSKFVAGDVVECKRKFIKELKP